MTLQKYKKKLFSEKFSVLAFFCPYIGLFLSLKYPLVHLYVIELIPFYFQLFWKFEFKILICEPCSYYSTTDKKSEKNYIVECISGDERRVL